MMRERIKRELDRSLEASRTFLSVTSDVGVVVVVVPSHSHMASPEPVSSSHLWLSSTVQVSCTSSQAPAQAKPRAWQYPLQDLYVSSKLSTSTLQSPQMRP